MLGNCSNIEQQYCTEEQYEAKNQVSAFWNFKRRDSAFFLLSLTQNITLKRLKSVTSFAHQRVLKRSKYPHKNH